MKYLLTPASERAAVPTTKTEIKQRAAEYGYEASYSARKRKWFFKPSRSTNLFPLTKLRSELRAAGVQGVTAK